MSKWIWHVIFLIFIAVSIPLIFTDLYENDIFMHIYLGEWIYGGGDTHGNANWTFGTDTQNFNNHLVVSEIIIFFIYKYLGLAGLVLIPVVGYVIFSLTLYYSLAKMSNEKSLLKDHSVAITTLITTIIVTLIMHTQLTIRPQTFLLMFLPLFMASLINIIWTGKNPKWYILSPVTIIAVSLHSYGLLIPLVITAAIIARFFSVIVSRMINKQTFLASVKAQKEYVFKSLLLIIILFLSSCINPIGINLWYETWNLKGNATQLIAEWAPVSIIDPISLALFGVFILWVTSWFNKENKYLLIFKEQEKSQTIIGELVLMITLWVALGSTTRTAILISIFFMFVMISRRLKDSKEEGRLFFKTEKLSDKSSSVVKKIFYPTIILSLLLTISIGSVNVGIDGEHQPIKIAEELKSKPNLYGSKTFTDFRVSSFILWSKLSVDQNASVSIDSRVNRYSEEDLMNHALQNFNKENKSWDKYQQSTSAIVDKGGRTYKMLHAMGWKDIMEEHGSDPNWQVTWVLMLKQ